MAQSSNPKLSICVATYNRAEFLRATLESIVVQLTDDCEILVADNASTDDTAAVVSGLTRRFDGLRYVGQETNKGLDRNFDYAVEQARGEYCWLFPDDDLLKPGAVARVLAALDQNLSLILVNMEFRTFDMSKVLRPAAMRVRSDRLYGAGELDRLFMDIDAARVYVGSIVVSRTLWLSRNREKYYGSLFMHVGAIFQQPLPGKALIISEPLISYRMGNTHSYSTALSDVWLGKWPAVVESLALSAATKRRLGNAEPWRNPRWLLLLRARGLYSLNEYRRWIHPRVSRTHEKLISTLIALLPGMVVNALHVVYFFLRRDKVQLLYMNLSPFHIRNTRIFRRA